MPWRRPDAQLAFRRRQRVGENEGALLGQPERRLVAAPSVVEGDETSWKPAAGVDGLQLGFGDVVTVEAVRTEDAGAVAADETDRRPERDPV